MSIVGIVFRFQISRADSKTDVTYIAAGTLLATYVLTPRSDGLGFLQTTTDPEQNNRRRD